MRVEEGIVVGPSGGKCSVGAILVRCDEELIVYFLPQLVANVVATVASGLEIQGTSLYSDYYFRRVIQLLEQSESVEIRYIFFGLLSQLLG